MGWWSTNRGGYSFTEEEGEEMAWGDGPADILGDAIDAIDGEFLEAWGRPATTHELVAGMRFSYPTIHVDPHKDQERPGLDSRDATVTVINEEEYEQSLLDPKWAEFCQAADSYIKSTDEPQPAVVDHGDLLEICQAAEAWASHLRTREHEGSNLNHGPEVADRIDKAIHSTRKTSYGTGG